MENNSIFSEDDQAPLIEILREHIPWFFDKPKDGKPLMSYEFKIIDLSKNEKDMYTL